MRPHYIHIASPVALPGREPFSTVNNHDVYSYLNLFVHRID
jgi:hypothetical protein